MRIPKSRNGKIPSIIKKRIYSRNPAPVDNPFLGEFKTGRNFITPSKLNKLIVKIISKII